MVQWGPQWMTLNWDNKMVQKHHQEEISGPSDLVEEALYASELLRPKRARIISRKARENRDRSLTFEVSF